MIVGEQRSRAESSLECLLSQQQAPRLEIVLGDLRPDLEPLRGSDDSTVRVIDVKPLAHIGPAMARLVEEARAPIVAFIEDHTYADAHWARAVVDAFERPEVAIVNYAMRDAGAQSWLSRSILFAEYGRWMDPAQEGPVAIAALHNVAYRVELLRRSGSRLSERLESAHQLHRSIQRAGGVAWLASTAIASHQDWPTFRDSCRANGIMKRLYSGLLVESGWGWPRRIAYAAAMSVATLLHVGRLAWSVRRRPRLWSTFVTSLPVTVPLFLYSSYQEALGYLLGPGEARDAFTHMEVGQRRSERSS